MLLCGYDLLLLGFGKYGTSNRTVDYDGCSMMCDPGFFDIADQFFYGSNDAIPKSGDLWP